MPDTVVLDCSVAAKWILPEPDRAPALRLLGEYEAGEVALIAPDLLLAEFASLLAKRHRRRQLTAEQAEEAFHLMGKALRVFSKRARGSPVRSNSPFATACLCGIAYISRSRSSTIVRSSPRITGYSGALAAGTLS